MCPFCPCWVSWCQEVFVIASSSPSLYIFCSHIKAHVLRLCSLDSVFLIHAGMPVSVWYSISTAHRTKLTLEGLCKYCSGSFPFFYCWSLLIVGDHWLSSSNQIRNCMFSFVWWRFCAHCSWGQAGFHTCLKSLENTILWELRWRSSCYWSYLEIILPDMFWY